MNYIYYIFIYLKRIIFYKKKNIFNIINLILKSILKEINNNF